LEALLAVAVKSVEREGEERVEADQEHEEGRDEVINGCCAVIGSHEQRY